MARSRRLPFRSSTRKGVANSRSAACSSPRASPPRSAVSSRSWTSRPRSSSSASEDRVDQIDVVLRPGHVTTVASDRLRERSGRRRSTVDRPSNSGARATSASCARFRRCSPDLARSAWSPASTSSTTRPRRAPCSAPSVMGELRLIGADRGILFRLLMIEAAVLGAVGALSDRLRRRARPLPRSDMVSESMGVIFQLRFPVRQLTPRADSRAAPSRFSASCTALFASYFAARRVARTSTRSRSFADARRRNPPRRHAPRSWWSAMVGMLQSQRRALHSECNSSRSLWGNFGSTSLERLGHRDRDSRSSHGPRSAALAGPASAASEPKDGSPPTACSVPAPAPASRSPPSRSCWPIGVTVSSLASSFRRSVTSYYEEGGFLSGDLVVSSTTTEGGWLETPLPADAVGQLAGSSGIAAVEAWRAIFGQIFRGERVALFGARRRLLDPARYDSRVVSRGRSSGGGRTLTRRAKASTSRRRSPIAYDLQVGDILSSIHQRGLTALPIVGDRARLPLGSRRPSSSVVACCADRWLEPGVSRIHVFLDPGVPRGPTGAISKTHLRASIDSRFVPLRDVVEYQASTRW